MSYGITSGGINYELCNDGFFFFESNNDNKVEIYLFN